MIDLYTAATPNGWKASITLEELGLEYEVHRLSLGSLEQRKPEYLKLNPNGRIPTIVDRDNDDFAVFESGAILVYLAEKAGKLLPTDVKGRSRVMQWLMFQMGGVGPMMGQANVFSRYAPEKLPWAITRYQKECRRLLETLDRHLTDQEWLADDYSIADIANYSWTHTHYWSGIDVAGLDHLARWHAAIAARAAVIRGLRVPEEVAVTEANADGDAAEQLEAEARKMLD